MSARRNLRRSGHTNGSLLVLVLMLMVGCDFGSAGDATLAPGNDCIDTAECAQGVCVAGFCADTASLQPGVVVEVLRGPSDIERAVPASWAFDPVLFGLGEIRDLSLPPTRQVVGVVRWKDMLVPASLRFSRRMAESVSALPAPTVSVDTNSPAAAANGPDDVDYNTVLVAGQVYDVVVLPTADLIEGGDFSLPAIRSLPPVYTALMVDDAIDAAPFRFDVTFPGDLDAECGENEFVGCTLTGQMLSFDGEDASAANGLQVRAVEKGSGRVVSSIGTTEGNGDYAIRVSADAGPYLIRATAPAGSGEPFPSVSIDPELAFANDPIERRVFVPKVQTVVFSGLVQGGNLLPVQGATVSFSSTGIFEESELGLEGSYTASTTTFDDGRFRVPLLPGSYDVTVTPPDDSRNMWAPMATQAFIVGDLLDLAKDEPIVLPSQVTLEGSCLTFAGDPASGVTVAARARGEAGGLQRSEETVSSPLGEYAMSVDAGLYDVVVKVADSTGFPWLVEPEFVIGPETATTRVFELPPPIVVRGVLRSANGAPVANAPIRAYVIESGDVPRPIQVAETASDEEGNYRLLISPTLDAR